MNVLVDSSVWIDYFRGAGDATRMEWLIDEGLLAINHVILAELLPPLEIRKEKKLIALLRNIRLLPLKIDWDELIRMQTTCLKNGINKVGVSDLVIAQNAIQCSAALYTRDKHFSLLSAHFPLKLFSLTATAHLLRNPRNARRLLDAVAELEEGRGKQRRLVE